MCDRKNIPVSCTISDHQVWCTGKKPQPAQNHKGMCWSTKLLPFPCSWERSRRQPKPPRGSSCIQAPPCSFQPLAEWTYGWKISLPLSFQINQSLKCLPVYLHGHVAISALVQPVLMNIQSPTYTVAHSTLSVNKESASHMQSKDAIKHKNYRSNLQQEPLFLPFNLWFSCSWKHSYLRHHTTPSDDVILRDLIIMWTTNIESCWHDQQIEKAFSPNSWSLHRNHWGWGEGGKQVLDFLLITSKKKKNHNYKSKG